MKIAIDCRSLRKKPAGVPNFLIGVINNMASHNSDWTIYLLSNEDFSPEAKAKLQPFENVIKIIDPLPVLPKIATLWYLLNVKAILKRLHADVFYSPTPNLPFNIPPEIRTMITVHDMVYKLFPETMSTGNRLINFFLHDFSINTSDKLWAVSDYTKKEIERLYPTRKCRSIVTGTSINKNIFYPREIDAHTKQRLLNRYNIKDKFILTVGTLEPRKNIQFLSSLMPVLAEDGFELLVVGAKGWGKSQPQTSSFGNVRFAGFVPEEDLVRLYAMASVYVTTSLNEGFCLPLLEAMQCGCPVVAAHNSAMIELVEGSGRTVSGWEEYAWVEAIRESSRNRGLYMEKGFQKARFYQWDSVIKQVTDYLMQ